VIVLADLEENKIMPSNRTRRMRKKKNLSLTMGEEHLLLTGECTPEKGSWKDYGESWTRPFILTSPAARDELRALWEAHKDSLMAGFDGKKLPWAAKEFDNASK